MLAEADFDVRDFEGGEQGNKGVHARFYWKPCLKEAESAEAGRPIYFDKEYVEIQAAGNATNIVNRPVTDLDRRRFRQAYTLFKSGDKDQIVGTRLTEVAWITRSQVEELSYLKVRTLEELAGVNDAVCNANPGWYALKRRAQTAIDSATSSAPITALQKENEDLKAAMDAMKQGLAEQAEMLRQMKEDAPRRGRPPKEASIAGVSAE